MTVTTCSACLHFNDFSESNGRGWCENFNKQVRLHHLATRDCTDAIAQHQSAIDEANGKLAGYLDAKNKSNSIPQDSTADWTEGYWTGFDDYLESVKSTAAPFHLVCTYHVKADLYQVKRQGKIIYMGHGLPAMAMGVRVQNIYR